MSIRSPPASMDLQELSKTHEAISEAKTQTWHRILTHYLPLYFPEVDRFAGNSRSDWFLVLIERFPTPNSTTIWVVTPLQPRSLVGRKVSKARLINDIYETTSFIDYVAYSGRCRRDHHVPPIGKFSQSGSQPDAEKCRKQMSGAKAFSVAVVEIHNVKNFYGERNDTNPDDEKYSSHVRIEPPE